MQSSNDIFMVKPSSFGFNEETSISNTFQNTSTENFETNNNVAVKEFENAVNILESEGVSILVVEDSPLPKKPDAIFPNNWISTHHDGKVILYPMCTPNRRIERENALLEKLKENYEVREVIDFSYFELDEIFLEGTGSIVFDHNSKIAYACISVRTDLNLFHQVCNVLGYKPISFHSFDKNNKLIYHTNIIMAIGTGFAIICLESIKDTEERKNVVQHLQSSNLEIIEISLDQVYHFLGNALEVKNKNNELLLVISETARKSLKVHQKELLSKFVKIISIDIPTIEHIGGGSIRCMIGQIFLNKN